MVRNFFKRKKDEEEPVDVKEEGFPEAPKSFEPVEQEDLENLKPVLRDEPEEVEEAEEESLRKELEEAEKERDLEKLRSKTMDVRDERRKLRRDRRFSNVKKVAEGVDKAEEKIEKGLKRVSRAGTGLAVAHGIRTSGPKRKTAKKGRKKQTVISSQTSSTLSQPRSVQPQFLPKSPMLLPSRQTQRTPAVQRLTILPQNTNLNAANPMGSKPNPRQNITLGPPKILAPNLFGKKKKKGFLSVI